MEEEKTYVKCKTCNKRAKSTCKNHLCYTCCSKNLKKICPHHQEELTRKTEEDRYIEEAILKSNAPNKSRKRLFRHEETKFTDFNQTVVIWCLRDFCQNKGMSAPTFTQLERVKSSNAVKRKRNSYKSSGSHVKIQAEVDDMTRIRRNLAAKDRKRLIKYKNLKMQWQKAVQDQDSNNNSTLWLVNQVST